MISPEEIKRQALRHWEQVLIDYAKENEFSPITIDRIGKVKSSQVHEQFTKLQDEVEDLLRESKNKTGVGYFVELSGQSFRRTGSHELPNRIIIESLEDFLHVSGKKREWSSFIKNYDFVISNLPSLKNWTALNTSRLLKPNINWNGIIAVCQYFLSVPKPNMYLRQLPIEIHTKFIEENSFLLISLLDFLIPDAIRDSRAKRFAERYFLKYDEPLIRIRVLDEAIRFQHNIKDLSLPLSSFCSLYIDCKRILITENKMNFFTLPEAPSAIALWSGGGFNISYLKNVEWLAHKEIYYWGDLDEHGFQILHQLRSYYPKTKSVLMDMETYIAFKKYAVSASPATVEGLPLLNTDETEVLNMLRLNPLGNRLEQEKISHLYVLNKFSELLS